MAFNMSFKNGDQMVIRYGVVLRSFMPEYCKFLLLDQQMGMLEVVASKCRCLLQITHGVLVQYTLHQRGRLFVVEDMAMVAWPAQWVCDDIVFLHHVLEVAQNFLVHHDSVEDVFRLFMRLFRPFPCFDASIDCALFKQFLLCRFFFIPQLLKLGINNFALLTT